MVNKVYVVYNDADMYDTKTMKVFATEEAAEAYIKSMPDPHHYFYQEWDVIQ